MEAVLSEALNNRDTVDSNRDFGYETPYNHSNEATKMRCTLRELVAKKQSSANDIVRVLMEGSGYGHLHH